MKEFLLKNKIIFIILALGFFYLLFFSRYDLDVDDEGFHLYVSNLIANGYLPYKDFLLPLTPLSFYFQALIFKIFSPTVMAGRVTMVFAGIYIMYMLWSISRHILPKGWISCIPSILFCFWGVNQIRHPWYGWYGLASALTMSFFCIKYLDTKKTSAVFLAGIFCGATILMKQNLGAGCLAAFLVFSLVEYIKTGGKQVVMGCALFAAGLFFSFAPLNIYFFIKQALFDFLYYSFGFAGVSAGKRFILNPFPHIKSSSIIILIFYMAIAFAYHRYLSSKDTQKKIWLFLGAFLSAAFIVPCVLLIVKVNDVDKIYFLDRFKTGALNGFFNIGMLGVLFGFVYSIGKLIKEKIMDVNSKKILFVSIFAIFYIWTGLCISRDHLHLVLAMPPAYILIAFMLSKIKFNNLICCVFPVVFMVYFGFFAGLKNEGFRSISVPIINMNTTVNIKNAKGIVVTQEKKKMLEDIVNYIDANTKESERIFDTNKSLLFYFLSDRRHPSFYYLLHSDFFRQEKQDVVINDIERYNVSVVITQKDKWDNIGYYKAPDTNPLTYKIWSYIEADYYVKKGFGEYYVLLKKIQKN